MLVVAHRIELIEQISQTLDRFGIEHGLIVSGKPVDETKQVQVASIQTLTRRIRTTDSDLNTKDHELDTDFSLIIIDEAHHAVAETYRMLWERWPKARFLGWRNRSIPTQFRTSESTHSVMKMIMEWP